jgi:hypothetical protein
MKNTVTHDKTGGIVDVYLSDGPEERLLERLNLNKHRNWGIVRSPTTEIRSRTNKVSRSAKRLNMHYHDISHHEGIDVQLSRDELRSSSANNTWPKVSTRTVVHQMPPHRDGVEDYGRGAYKPFDRRSRRARVEKNKHRSREDLKRMAKSFEEC